MSDWRFYDPATGLFHRKQMSCPGSQLARNTPAGYVPIPGAFDPLSQRVDISVQRPDDADADWQPPVIDWTPPAPAADEWQTWDWDKERKRWVSAPTLAALKRDAERRIQEQLADEDAALVRPLGELVVALAAGDEPPAAALSKLQEIEARKQALRTTMAEASGAADAQALEQIETTKEKR